MAMTRFTDNDMRHYTQIERDQIEEQIRELQATQNYARDRVRPQASMTMRVPDNTPPIRMPTMMVTTTPLNNWDDYIMEPPRREEIRDNPYFYTSMSARGMSNQSFTDLFSRDLLKLNELTETIARRPYFNHDETEKILVYEERISELEERCNELEAMVKAFLEKE